MSIMDLIMFDAQRQGRLSFYMVCFLLGFVHPVSTLTGFRSQQAKKASQLDQLLL